MPRLKLSVQELQSVLDVVDAAICLDDDRPCLRTAAADILAALPAEHRRLSHNCGYSGCGIRRQRYIEAGCDYRPQRELESIVMGEVRFRGGGMQDVSTAGGWHDTNTLTLGNSPTANHTDTAISVDTWARANFRVTRWVRSQRRDDVGRPVFDEHLIELHRARLARQHEAAMAPTLPVAPVLPLLPGRASWPPAVRAWLRQPVRLRKGSRESDVRRVS